MSESSKTSSSPPNQSPHIFISRNKARTQSFDSDNGSHPGNGDLPPPVLVYHSSARSIVFRDQLRRAVSHQQVTNNEPHMHAISPDENANADETTAALNETRHEHIGKIVHLEKLDSQRIIQHPSAGLDDSVLIAGYIQETKPLEQLDLGPSDSFLALLLQNPNDRSTWSKDEKEVVHMLETQHAVVKTIKNTDWTQFVNRFLISHTLKNHTTDKLPHDDIAPHADFAFNSFVTSATLLPSGGKKMRAYGSTSQYTTGVVFALPTFATPDAEDRVQKATSTWAWPAGYSAKTEFNRDSRGNLINGRAEALKPLSILRQ
jgi:hypothetical protein